MIIESFIVVVGTMAYSMGSLGEACDAAPKDSVVIHETIKRDVYTCAGFVNTPVEILAGGYEHGANPFAFKNGNDEGTCGQTTKTLRVVQCIKVPKKVSVQIIPEKREEQVVPEHWEELPLTGEIK